MSRRASENLAALQGQTNATIFGATFLHTYLVNVAVVWVEARALG